MKYLLLLFVILLFSCQSPQHPPPDNHTKPPGPHKPLALTRYTETQPAEAVDPHISPDGKFLFFATYLYTGNYDIYKVPVEGGSRIQVISSPNSNERLPAVNPRFSSMLAFCSDKNGEWDIYVVEDMQEEPHKWIKISQQGVDDIHPSWSYDGTKIVYCSSPVGRDEWTLKIFDLELNRLFELDIDGLAPSWSPADNTIAFQRQRSVGKRFGSIWSLKFENGIATDIKEVFGSDEFASITPAFSKDGKKIVFVSVAKTPQKRQNLFEGDDLFLINSDGTGLIQLFSTHESEWKPSFSPDGRIFFVSNRESKNDIYSIKPEQ